LTFLHHPGVQPFLNQPEDAAVRDAMLQELDHPAFVDSIEKGPDISVHNVVHFLPQERIRQRIQRLMLATPRAKPIREAQKVLLIDRIEDGDHAMLDNLVLQRGYPQRTLPSVGFRDIHPPRRLRSVRSTVDPAAQIDQSILQPGLIRLPRGAVHPRSRFPR